MNRLFIFCSKGSRLGYVCERHAAGFTLIELVVVVAILAILATIAIPSFESVIASNRVSKEANELKSSLEFASSQAYTTGLPVIVCPSADGVSCQDTVNWEGGWIIAFSQANCAGALATASPLRVRPAFSATAKDFASYASSKPHSNFICFNRAGHVDSGNFGSFVIDVVGSSSHKRCLAMSQTGHVTLLLKGKVDSISGVTCL